MLHNHLLSELSPLNLNLARLKCLILLLSGMLRHRTVNLTILATENLSGAKNESCYRRFQNFFLQSSLSITAVGGFILSKIPKPQQGWVLSMDRTNWKYGKRHINILTVGVIVNNIAIPIAWKVLPQKTKRGNSHTRHRKAIISKALRLMRAQDIYLLAMDREFGGSEWLKWLDMKGVGYVLRVKSNTVIGKKLAREYASTRNKKSGHLRQKVWGNDVFFACKTIQCKGRRDDKLYVISNRYSGKKALELYHLRWGIELLFSHLKKRGFNLEDTHMSEARKLEKLFALVSLAFLFSFAWGCELRSTRKQTKAMKRKSIFRLGLEDIIRLLNNPHLPREEREAFTDWLKSPYWSKIFIV